MLSTIHPLLLRDQLEHTRVDYYLAASISDYLTNQPHYVKVWDCGCLQHRGFTGNSPGYSSSEMQGTLLKTCFTLL